LNSDRELLVPEIRLTGLKTPAGIVPYAAMFFTGQPFYFLSKLFYNRFKSQKDQPLDDRPFHVKIFAVAVYDPVHGSSRIFILALPRFFAILLAGRGLWLEPSQILL
jgi:hypothetical protein